MSQTATLNINLVAKFPEAIKVIDIERTNKETNVKLGINLVAKFPKTIKTIDVERANKPTNVVLGVNLVAKFPKNINFPIVRGQEAEISTVNSSRLKDFMDMPVAYAFPAKRGTSDSREELIDFETNPEYFAGDWERSATTPHSGTYCYKNKTTGPSQTSRTRMIVTAQSGARLSFFYRTSSEGGYDKLIFKIDGTTKLTESGQKPWNKFETDLAQGSHVLSWEYTKDGSGSSGEDSVYIDELRLLRCAHPQTHIIDFENDPEGFIGDWERTTTSSGTYYRSKAITHSQTSKTEYKFKAGDNSLVSFYYRVSSEPSYDKFIFKIDDAVKITDSGSKGWTPFETALSPGKHTLSWEYTKDGSNSSSEDLAAIDDLVFIDPAQEINYTNESSVDAKRTIEVGRISSLSVIDTRREIGQPEYYNAGTADTTRHTETIAPPIRERTTAATKRSKDDPEYYQANTTQTMRQIETVAPPTRERTAVDTIRTPEDASYYSVSIMDTSREIEHTEIIRERSAADVKRSIETGEYYQSSAVNTSRHTETVVPPIRERTTITTSREVQFANYPVCHESDIDTDRRAEQAEYYSASSANTRRNIDHEEASYISRNAVSTSRTIEHVEIIRECSAINTKRRIGIVTDTFTVDLKRRLSGPVKEYATTVCQFPTTIGGTSSDIKKISLALSGGEWTDTMRITTFGRFDIDDRIVIDYKNYNQEFVVNQTDFTEKNCLGINKKTPLTVTAVYDTLEMLRKPTGYLAQGDDQDQYITLASSTFKGVVKALGKSSIAKFDDYGIISMGEAKPTFSDVTSQVFGWTKNTPHKQINVFQRQNTVYAVQRGKEDTVVTLSTYHEAISYNKKKMDLITDCSDTTDFPINSSLNGITKPKYFSGTITTEGYVQRYANGLLTYERRTEKRDGKKEDFTTQYSYTSSKDDYRFSGQLMVDTEYGKTISKTTYAYNTAPPQLGLDDPIYLSEQTTVEYEYEYMDKPSGPSNKITSTKTRTTTYAPTGINGSFAVQNYEDGEWMSGNIQQGASSGTASRYQLRQASKNNDDTPKIKMPGRYVGGTYFPVAIDKLNKIIKDIIWLNGKIQETINLIITNAPSIFDFTARYIWRDNEYYLERNNIEIDGETCKQNLTLVRWYAK